MNDQSLFNFTYFFLLIFKDFWSYSINFFSKFIDCMNIKIKQNYLDEIKFNQQIEFLEIYTVKSFIKSKIYKKRFVSLLFSLPLN